MQAPARLLAAALLFGGCARASTGRSERLVAQDAPCGQASERAGFRLAEGGLTQPTVSVSVFINTTALCPGDGLGRGGRVLLHIDAGTDDVYVHVVVVGSAGEVVALTHPGGEQLTHGMPLELGRGTPFYLSSDEGVDIIFIASLAPLSVADPELAQLVARAAAGTAGAEQMRLAPRGEVAIDAATHRVDGRATSSVVVIPFPVVAQATRQHGITRAMSTDFVFSGVDGP